MSQINIKTSLDQEYDGSQALELFKVKKKQIIMMGDRGFDISKEKPLLNYRISDFISVYRNIAEQRKASFKEALNNLYTREDGISIYVFYPETPKGSSGPKKISQDQIKNIIKFMTDNEIINIILITETTLSPDAIKAFENIPSRRMENFLYEEMTYNPTEHYLVPKHTLLTDEEAKNFLQRNKLNLKDLPKISYEDPITRYYGAVPGQIFKIDRENLSIDTLINSYSEFRQVVHTGLDLPI